MTRKNRSRPAPQQGKQLTAPAPAPDPVAGPETPPAEPVIDPTDPASGSGASAIDAELAALDGAAPVAGAGEPATPSPDEQLTLAAVSTPAAPAPDPVQVQVQEVRVVEKIDTPRLSPEPTLHELNQRAWAIDDEHAAKRLEAQEKIREVAEPLLAGVQRGRERPRRVQKPLRYVKKG